MTTKKKTKPSGEIKVQKIADVEFAGQPKRGSRYDAFFEVLTDLNPGEVATLPLGDLDKKTAHDRMAAALKRSGPEPKKGYRWSKRTTKDGQMAVFLKKIK